MERWEQMAMVVESLVHEFQIEETNGNEWNVLGHGVTRDMARKHP
jgi:hypothetical protein